MEIIEKMRDVADEKIDNAFEVATVKMMKKHVPRWLEICGVDTVDDIDFTIPCIEVESKLCDPRNLKKIRGGEHTDEFLELLSSD